MKTIWPSRTLTGAAAVALAAVLAGCGSTDGEATDGPDEIGVAAEATTSTTEAPQEDSTPDDQGTPSSTTSAATTTEPSTDETSVPDPVVDLSEVLSPGGDPQALEPGRYTAGAFTSDAVIDLGSPLNVYYFDDSALVVRDTEFTEEQEGAVIFTAPLGVLPPDQAGVHQPHEPVVPEAAIPIPDDVGAWLRSIEQIEITDTGSAELGEVTGTWYEFEVRENSQTFDCNSSPSCIGLVALPDGVWTFQEGRAHRLYELDAFPGLVAWAVAAPGEETLIFESADAVIAGLTAP